MKYTAPASLMFVALFAISLSGCGYFGEGPTSASATAVSDRHGNHDHGEPDGSSFAVDQVVDASCGQCQFGMEGDDCDLAIRLDGQAYYVDGSAMDDHGDAHGDDGMCDYIRKAKVKGEIRNGRFVATSFKLLPADDTGER